jgi:hypothetical protein
MTATPTIPQPVDRGLPDLRCGCSLGTPSGEQGRCQLFGGHEGRHALLYTAAGRRRVRTWTGHDPTTARDGADEIAGRPWMLGYPVPAWIVDDD